MDEVHTYSASALWSTEEKQQLIPSFGQGLDAILGGEGLQLGELTEVLGLPGTGKTQLCLQLCASTQVPRSLKGLEAEALYIDTNTNFTACRYKEILSATLSRCLNVLGQDAGTVEDALKKLHYVNAFGLMRYCLFMQQLPDFVAEHPDIKLIVIDSITFPFKVDIAPTQRTGLLFRQMAELQKLAVEKQIAVVLTNEMTTRVNPSGSSIVGAMGDAWAHRCNRRVLLSTVQGNRLALLLKGHQSMLPVKQFQITHEGIAAADTT